VGGSPAGMGAGMGAANTGAAAGRTNCHSPGTPQGRAARGVVQLDPARAALAVGHPRLQIRQVASCCCSEAAALACFHASISAMYPLPPSTVAACTLLASEGAPTARSGAPRGLGPRQSGQRPAACWISPAPPPPPAPESAPTPPPHAPPRTSQRSPRPCACLQDWGPWRAQGG